MGGDGTPSEADNRSLVLFDRATKSRSRRAKMAFASPSGETGGAGGMVRPDRRGELGSLRELRHYPEAAWDMQILKAKT